MEVGIDGPPPDVVIMDGVVATFPDDLLNDE